MEGYGDGSGLAGGVLDPASAEGCRQVAVASLCHHGDGDGDAGPL